MTNLSANASPAAMVMPMVVVRDNLAVKMSISAVFIASLAGQHQRSGLSVAGINESFATTATLSIFSKATKVGLRNLQNLLLAVLEGVS
jgi:hypothetical protein